MSSVVTGRSSQQFCDLLNHLHRGLGVPGENPPRISFDYTLVHLVASK